MKPVFISNIQQKNNHVFSIVWNDGIVQDFRLSDLQKNCPCAACIDETTGERLIKTDRIDEDVMAVSVKSIGRYAIKIHYTNGCSAGIYSYDFLRHFNSNRMINL